MHKGNNKLYWIYDFSTIPDIDCCTRYGLKWNHHENTKNQSGGNAGPPQAKANAPSERVRGADRHAATYRLRLRSVGENSGRDQDRELATHPCLDRDGAVGGRRRGVRYAMPNDRQEPMASEYSDLIADEGPVGVEGLVQ